MTNPGVEAFVDAILADQSPKRFAATPDDADLLRLAIELYVSRSPKTCPTPSWSGHSAANWRPQTPGTPAASPFAVGPRPVGVRGHPWCPAYRRPRAGLPVDASAPSVPRRPPWPWWPVRSAPPSWHRPRRQLPWRSKVPLPPPRSALARS